MGKNNLQSSIFNLQSIKKIILFVFLLLIPTQLGKHFWTSGSYVLGNRVDYLSLTLYLIDVVWGIWIIFNLQFLIFKKKESIFPNPSLTRGGQKLWLLVGILFMVVNILMAGNKMVAVMAWMRIWQWAATVIIVYKNKNEVGRCLKLIVPIWIVGESLLGVAQLIKAGSVGGIFYWLGERTFNFNTIGIAQMGIDGYGLLRAYGTFSHPNSLAGFLLVAVMWWQTQEITLPFRASLFEKRGIKMVWWWVVNLMAILGIIVAGSRTVWILAIIFNLQSLIFNKKQVISKMAIVLGIVMLMWVIIDNNFEVGRFLSGWDKEGIPKREILARAAISMIWQNPIWGVGASNFISELPDYWNNSKRLWLQPVHNIPLLAWSELGIGGIILIIFNLQSSIFNLQSSIYGKEKRGGRNKWIWIGVVVLVTGVVDHYWVTLPQNRWLLAVLLGLLV